jgi:hypothetical protein
MSAIAEPPPTSSAATSYDPGAAQSIFNPESAPPKQEAQPQVEAPQTTVKTEAPEGQKLVDKPDAMKSEGEKGKKSRLDQLTGLKKPEEKAEPKTVEKAVEDKPVDMGNAKQLREAYEKQKQDMAALRAELEKVKPNAEKLEQYRKDLDMSREELSKLKALNLNDEERGQYSKLQELHALDVLRESPEYQQKIMAPIQSRLGKIESAIKEAKLNPVAAEALKTAIDIQDEFARNREIRRVFKEAELDPDDLNDFTSSMVRVAGELNDQYYPALEAKEKQALEIQAAARLKDKEQAEQSTTKEKQEFQKEHEFVRNLLKEDKLKLLFEDTDLSVDDGEGGRVTLAEALENAAPADNPRDRAYEVNAGAAMPFMIEYLNKLLAKNHTLEEANRLRNGSQPKRGDAVQKGVELKETPIDANDVFKRQGPFGS